MAIKLKSLNEFLEEEEIKDYQELSEALITFGGKAYPKFGQVVILAGGAGSGKGFISSNLMGLEGIVFDVDKLKELIMASEKYKQIAIDKFGIDVSTLNLKNPDDVSKLHDIVSALEITDKKIKAAYTSIIAAAPERKPNIIFDITMKDLNKFYNTLRNVEEMGYWKKNISLIWVLNTIDVAQAQNTKRDRVVPDEILLATHQGASYTMSEILRMGDTIRKYLDGDIFIAFNQTKVDSDVLSREHGGEYIKKDGTKITIDGTGEKSKAKFIKSADYIQLKEKEKSPIPFAEIKDEIIKKIQSYVPNSNVWN